MKQLTLLLLQQAGLVVATKFNFAFRRARSRTCLVRVASKSLLSFRTWSMIVLLSSFMDRSVVRD